MQNSYIFYEFYQEIFEMPQATASKSCVFLKNVCSSYYYCLGGNVLISWPILPSLLQQQKKPCKHHQLQLFLNLPPLLLPNIRLKPTITPLRKRQKIKTFIHIFFKEKYVVDQDLSFFLHFPPQTLLFHM